MNYTEWLRENLSLTHITVHGKSVALWQTGVLVDRPTLLLVHGITGDHFGLVPLLEQLSVNYNCIVIELPGHGLSEENELADARTLQQWFSDAQDIVEAQVAHIDVVCAHSFGCSAVVGPQNNARDTKTILLNPVPWPSDLYSQYARLIMRFAGFWAIFYNLHLFIFLRSMTLAKINTNEARGRIGYVSKYSRPSYRQVIYQAGLVDIILDGKAYSHVKDTVDLVVCGIDDTTARERDSVELGAVFGSSPVIFLRGGHLLPIESPEAVAKLISQVI